MFIISYLPLIFKWLLICLAFLIIVPFTVQLIIWIVLILACFTIPMNKEYSSPSNFYRRLFNLGYWSLCKLARVRIHTSGLENVPYGTRFMFISNHRSKFDNMIHSLVLHKENVAFISKPENFNIPIGRHFMVRQCYLPIERGNPKSGLKTILKASDYISKGLTSIGVFPEGTRSLDGKLLEFKPGCFKIAEKTGCPIVIGVTQGTQNIHKNFPWKRTDVYFDIIKLISPDEIFGKKTVELSDYSRNLISSYLESDKKD